MTDLYILLKQSTRACQNQLFRDYTGLCNEYFFGLDYGEPSYVTHFALFQLHTQIESLRIFAVSVQIYMDFTDRKNFPSDDEVIVYHLEVITIVTPSHFEEI